jgi:hypothetical protein
MNEARAPDARLACRSYTHARRHPWVIGKIGGWALPTPLSPTQLLVLVSSFLVLLWTRAAWAHLPGVVNLAIQAGLPMTLAWTVRHVRMEGRPPLRMIAGAVVYAASPKGGVLYGRPYREAGPKRMAGARIFVAAMPGAAVPAPWVPGGPAQRRAARRPRREG